jgi:FkbM family methyltransferase
MPVIKRRITKESRPTFDFDYYCQHNSDVVDAHGSNLDRIWAHFIQHGQFENRKYRLKKPIKLRPKEAKKDLQDYLSNDHLPDSLRLVSRDEMESYFKDKRIAVVGPSISTLDTKEGNYLETFDIVIRLKKSVPVPSEYHPYIGQRTDILCTHLKISQNNFDQVIVRGNSIKYFLLPFPLIPPFDSFLKQFCHYLSEREQQKNIYNKIYLYYLSDKLAIDHYARQVQQLKSTPTTGCALLINLLTYSFKELYITGFTFRQDGYCPAYKNADEDVESYQRTMVARTIHDMDKEIAYFKTILLSDKRIKLASHMKKVLRNPSTKASSTSSSNKISQINHTASSVFHDDTYISLYSTKYGKFWVYNNDEWIGRVIRMGEAWDHKVINKMVKHIRTNSIVVDVGANIGTHSIPYSRYAKQVYCFEPQSKIYQLLVKNIAENNRTNIVTHQYALGHLNTTNLTMCSTIPDGRSKGQPIDYQTSKMVNYGGIELGLGGEQIEMRTLDSLNLSNVSYLKIDVEGAEKLVIYGAQETIRRDRPVILYENKKQVSDQMKQMLLSVDQGYPAEVEAFDIQQFLFEQLRYRSSFTIKNDIICLP